MHIEIVQAAEFLCRLLQTKLDPDPLSKFKDRLIEVLKSRYADHWDTTQPYRGNAYRAISNFSGVMDDALLAAAKNADIDAKLLHSYLPRDFVLWIDPFSVAYRVGDHGNIMTLFEDRSRGRITFKVDPASNHNESIMNGSPALPTSVINGAFKSPVNSPRLAHLQPRSNAVRITPPNSPEKNDLTTKKSRGQSQTSQQQTGAQEQQSQQLVLAN
ncbi:hypothetical protein BC943DRAFT_317878 [Umbelopsis sp. AD052]|nr:hypothetical protein BC943DRAFT_317878 [Umbelopsis sp. AD052]